MRCNSAIHGVFLCSMLVQAAHHAQHANEESRAIKKALAKAGSFIYLACPRTKHAVPIHECGACLQDNSLTAQEARFFSVLATPLTFLLLGIFYVSISHACPATFPTVCVQRCVS